MIGSIYPIAGGAPMRPTQAVRDQHKLTAFYLQIMEVVKQRRSPSDLISVYQGVRHLKSRMPAVVQVVFYALGTSESAFYHRFNVATPQLVAALKNKVPDARICRQLDFSSMDFTSPTDCAAA